jgi:hypothetical protein
LAAALQAGFGTAEVGLIHLNPLLQRLSLHGRALPGAEAFETGLRAARAAYRGGLAAALHDVLDTLERGLDA